MKTLLGFIVLVLYTFTMLAWGHPDTLKICRNVASSSHAACPRPGPSRQVIG